MHPKSAERSFIARGAVALLAFGMTLLAGCQSVSPGWRDDVRKSIDRELDEAAKQKDKPPVDVGKALLPPLDIRLPDGQPAVIEPRFDLAVSGAPARQVFMGLVEGTRYSMVVHPEVSGTVSLNLKNVTVPEALKAIREVYGYEFRRDGDRFFILGNSIQTRIFSVNYLNLARKGKSKTRVTSGGIGRQTSTGASTSTATTTTEESGFSNISLETNSETEFWIHLTETLKTIVGTEGGRKVVVNPIAGVVTVRAYPSELRVVEEYLGVTHAAVNRQVVLEAKILEVRLADAFQAGINWAYLGNKYTIGQVGGGSIFSSDSFTSGIGGNTGNLNPGIDQTIGTGVSAFGGVFTIAGGSDNFQAFVELLKGQGEVQVLSSPRVSTVNNQKAVIKIGGDEFFVTGVSSTGTTVATGGVVQTVPDVTLQSFFSGIVLDVTPQIDEERNIILHVHPSVSTVEQQNKQFEIAKEPFTLPLALSTIQESDSVVRTHSGRIIVIGGLMREGSTDKNASVPFVGDVPVVGNLFKQQQIARVKRELVILLKATVIENGEQWGDAVSESRRRFDGIRLQK